MQRPLSAWVALIVLMLVGTGISGIAFRAVAAEQPITEPQVKAAYLRRIAFYTEWPTNRFAVTNSPVIIGVIGKSDVLTALEEISRRPKSEINGRKLVVRRLTLNDDLSQCHVVFIARESDFAPVLAKLKETSVLVVAEHADFARSGGMVNFVNARDGTVKFEVNHGVAVQAGLRISPSLLDVVRDWGMLVEAGPKKGTR